MEFDQLFVVNQLIRDSNLIRNWRLLCRSFEIPYSEWSYLDAGERTGCVTNYEIFYTILELWKSRKGKAATLSALQASLRNLQFIAVAESLENVSNTSHSTPPDEEVKFTLDLDTTLAPNLFEFGIKVKREIEEWYPKIAEYLSSPGFVPPQKISLTFDPEYKERRATSGNDKIQANAEYYTSHQDDISSLIGVTIFSIQKYITDPGPPSWLTYGIKNYCQRYLYEGNPLHKLNVSDDDFYNKTYEDHSDTAAYLLNYVNTTYGRNKNPDIIQAANMAARAGQFNEETFWTKMTGKTIEALWEELLCRDASDWLTTSEPVEYLGHGSFGIVFKVDDPLNNKPFAVKMIFAPQNTNDLDDNERAIDFAQEFKILEKTKPHENVVQCLAYVVKELTEEEIETYFKNARVDEDNHDAQDQISIQCNRAKRGCSVTCLKMELCGPTLRSWLNVIQSREMQLEIELQENIAQGIIDGLAYLHQQNILHRDLKPENIYFSYDPDVSNNYKYLLPIKIGDFGISRKIDKDQAMTFTKNTGCFLYRAPEVDTQRYGSQADLFSLGLILWEHFEMIPYLKLRSQFSLLVWENEEGLVQENDRITNLKSLIIGLTRKNPKQRICSIMDVCLCYH